MRLLLAATACCALLALGLGSQLRADEPALEARVATLEKEVAALKERLAKLEGARAAKPARRGDRAARIEDLNKLRQITGLIVVAEKAPVKDGALDPYSFVRMGDVDRKYYDIFRSVSLGQGPTDDEIERGDYTNFPWERYRGDGSDIRGPAVIPLLWEKEPGADGGHLVGMNDGSARILSPEELKALLKR
ncbi:MAG: hypothetical protein ACHQ1G_13145 [Planctomycetota bacterium]